MSESARAAMQARVDEWRAARVGEDEDGPGALLADAVRAGDVARLRELALQGGLGESDHAWRRVAWPMMLLGAMGGPGATDGGGQPRTAHEDAETLRQIALDVPRTVVGLADQNHLGRFLRRYFAENRDLNFYQGFANVAWTVIRIMGGTSDNQDDDDSDLPARFVLERLSRDSFLRDAHRATFDAVFALLRGISSVVQRVDPPVAKVLTTFNDYWGIAFLVTLGSHVSFTERGLLSIARIFDAVIAGDVTLPPLLVAALPLLPSVRDKLLAVSQQDTSTSVHEILSRASAELLQPDELIARALDLSQRVPEDVLFSSEFPPDAFLWLAHTQQGLRNSRSPFRRLRKRSWRTFSSFLASTTSVAAAAATSLAALAVNTLSSEPVGNSAPSSRASSPASHPTLFDEEEEQEEDFVVVSSPPLPQIRALAAEGIVII